MIVPFMLFFSAIFYFVYKSKDEVVLLEKKNIDSKDDDLFKELEDLFI